jgi:hypothetical protein
MQTTRKANVEARSAWLVTWEGTSVIPEDAVAAILHHQMSASTVKEFVERLYVSLMRSQREKLLVVKNPRANPYPANMTPFEHIHCGHNPFLHARLVSKLKVVDDALQWKEPPSETERRAKSLR